MEARNTGGPPRTKSMSSVVLSPTKSFGFVCYASIRKEMWGMAASPTSTKFNTQRVPVYRESPANRFIHRVQPCYIQCTLHKAYLTPCTSPFGIYSCNSQRIKNMKHVGKESPEGDGRKKFTHCRRSDNAAQPSRWLSDKPPKRLSPRTPRCPGMGSTRR